MKKNIYLRDKYDRKEVAKDIESIYVFGDNTNDRVYTHYVPSSTQAVIRGLKNTMGIDTKRDRGTRESSYFKDDNFGIYKRYIDKVIDKLEEHQSSGKRIVFPSGGIGTGKAMLKEKAPKLFNYLSERLFEKFGFKNGDFHVQTKQQKQENRMVTKRKRLAR